MCVRAPEAAQFLADLTNVATNLDLRGRARSMTRVAPAGNESEFERLVTLASGRVFRVLVEKVPESEVACPTWDCQS